MIPNYETVRILPEDISFKLDPFEGTYMIDPNSIKKVLIDRMRSSKENAEKLVTDLYESYSESLMKFNDGDNHVEKLRDFIRIVKMHYRHTCIEDLFKDNGLSFIDYNSYYDINDLYASFTFHTALNKMNRSTGFISLGPIVDSLIGRGIVLPDERERVIDKLVFDISSSPGWNAAALADNLHQYNYSVRKLAKPYIDKLILDRWYYTYNNNLLDQVTVPYITINDGSIDLKDVGAEKAGALMMTLGYKMEESIEILGLIVDKLVMISTEFEDPDNEIHLFNLRFLNCLYINSIKGNTSIKTFDLDYCYLLEYSQLEIEGAFIDLCVTMARFENLMIRFKEETGKERHELSDYVHELSIALTDTIRSTVRDNSNHPYEVFKAVSEHIDYGLKGIK